MAGLKDAFGNDTTLDDFREEQRERTSPMLNDSGMASQLGNQRGFVAEQPSEEDLQNMRDPNQRSGPSMELDYYSPDDGTIPWQQFRQDIGNSPRPKDEEYKLANAFSLSKMLDQDPVEIYKHGDAIARELEGKETPPTAFNEKIKASFQARKLMMERADIMWDIWKNYPVTGNMQPSEEQQARLDEIKEEMPSDEALEASNFLERFFMAPAGQAAQLMHNNWEALKTTAPAALAGTILGAMALRGGGAGSVLQQGAATAGRFGRGAQLGGQLSTAGQHTLRQLGKGVANTHLVGQAAQGGKTELGFHLSELMQTKAPNGQEIPDNVKWWSAGAYGTMATALEFAGARSAASLIPGFRDLLQDGMQGMIVKGTLGEILKQHAGRYGANAMVQSGEELSQAVTDGLLKEAAITKTNQEASRKEQREFNRWKNVLETYQDRGEPLPEHLQEEYNEFVEKRNQEADKIVSEWKEIMPNALREAEMALYSSLVLGAPAAAGGTVTESARFRRNGSQQMEINNDYSQAAARDGDGITPFEDAIKETEEAKQDETKAPSYTSSVQVNVSRSRQIDEDRLAGLRKRTPPPEDVQRVESDFAKRVMEVRSQSRRKELLANEQSRLSMWNAEMASLTDGRMQSAWDDPGMHGIMLDLERFDPRTGEVIRPMEEGDQQVVLTNDFYGVDGISNDHTVRAHSPRLMQKYNLSPEQAEEMSNSLMEDVFTSQKSVELFESFTDRDQVKNRIQEVLTKKAPEQKPTVKIHWKFQTLEDFAADRPHITDSAEIARQYNQSLENFFEVYDEVQTRRQRAEEFGVSPNVEVYLAEETPINSDQRITFRTIRDRLEREQRAPKSGKMQQYLAEKANPLRGFRPGSQLNRTVWEVLNRDRHLVENDSVYNEARLQDIRSMLEENPDFSETDSRLYRAKNPVTAEQVEEIQDKARAKRKMRAVERGMKERERTRVGYTQDEAEVAFSAAFNDLFDAYWTETEGDQQQASQYATRAQERIWNMMERMAEERGETLKRNKDTALDHRRWNTALNIHIDSNMGQNIVDDVFRNKGSLFENEKTAKQVARLERMAEKAEQAEELESITLPEQSLDEIKSILDSEFVERLENDNLEEADYAEIAIEVTNNLDKLDPQVQNYIRRQVPGIKRLGTGEYTEYWNDIQRVVRKHQDEKEYSSYFQEAEPDFHRGAARIVTDYFSELNEDTQTWLEFLAPAQDLEATEEEGSERRGMFDGFVHGSHIFNLEFAVEEEQQMADENVEVRGMWDEHVRPTHIEHLISEVNDTQRTRRLKDFDVKTELKNVLLQDEHPKAQVLARAMDPPEELKKMAQELRQRYDALMDKAIDNRVITEVEESYAARYWDDEQQTVYVGEPTPVRSFTRHNLNRDISSIIEGWAQGKKLKIEEATVAFEVYANEIAQQVALRRFIETGEQMYDMPGKKLFAQAPNVQGYRAVNIGAFKHKLYLGEVEQTQDGDFIEGGRPIEEHHALEGNSVFEYRDVYTAPKIARVLEEAFSQNQLEGNTAVRLWMWYSQFRKKVKLLSNFFHPTAYLRSYEFGTNHKSLGMTLRPFKTIKEYHKLLQGKESQWVDRNLKGMNEQFVERYGLSRDMNMATRELIDLLGAQGLTMDMKKDFWNLMKSEESAVLTEARKHSSRKETIDMMKHMINTMQWLTFDVMGPSLKTASAVTELVHAMNKQPEIDPSVHAKRIAQLMNDDYGGLNLRREARNQAHQFIFRSLIMAPDWTESNVRTMARMFDGRVDQQTRKQYRKFWLRAGIKIMSLNTIANFMMGMMDTKVGGSEDPIDFIYNSKLSIARHMMQVGEHPEALRKAMHLTEVDVTPLWRWTQNQDIGVAEGLAELERGEQVYTDAIGGHFADFVKFAAFPMMSAWGKKAMPVQDAVTMIFRQDWKGYEMKRPGEVEYEKLNDVFDPEAYVKYSSGGGAPAASLYDQTAFTALAHIITNSLPVQMDQWVAFHAGREDAMRAILTSMGIGVSSMKPYRSGNLNIPSGGGKW